MSDDNSAAEAKSSKKTAKLKDGAAKAPKPRAAKATPALAAQSVDVQAPSLTPPVAPGLAAPLAQASKKARAKKVADPDAAPKKRPAKTAPAAAVLVEATPLASVEVPAPSRVAVKKHAAKTAAPEPVAAPEPDPTAKTVMSAADAEYAKDKAVETAKKAGIAAAAVGVLGGLSLMLAKILGGRKA